MTENEFREAMARTVPHHDNTVTDRWMDSVQRQFDQLHNAMYAFSFVNCNFKSHVLDAVYRMEPFSILKIPEVALRINAGGDPDKIAKDLRSGWGMSLGFTPTSSFAYRAIGLYTLVSRGRAVHFYSPFCHIHGKGDPFVGLEDYAQSIGKRLVDAFYAAGNNPALADWYDDDELPRGTIIFRRTFDEEANLLIENLHTSTAIGPVYRRDYDNPEKSFAWIDHIG